MSENQPSAFQTATIQCPYCNREIPRTVRSQEDIDMLGEHCDYCFLPFDVDQHGDGVGQDGERAVKPWTPMSNTEESSMEQWTKQRVAVADIRAGDAFAAPAVSGGTGWTALEDASIQNGEVVLPVQYVDGGIGPARVWADPTYELDILRRA